MRIQAPSHLGGKAAINKWYTYHFVHMQICLWSELPKVELLHPRTHTSAALVAIAKLPPIWAMQIYTPTARFI